MSTDPARLLQKYVKIKGLASKPELNSQVGFVDSYLVERSRYLITLPSHVSIAPIALKSENLDIANMLDRSKSKVEEIIFMAKAVLQDERFKETIRRSYTSIDQRLPGPVKPQHLIAGFFLAVILIVKMIGLTKFLFVSSAFMIILAVSFPDLVSGRRDIKTLLLNFPTRWNEAIEQSIGVKPPTRVGNAILLLFLLLVGKVLFVSKSTPPETFGYESLYEKETNSRLPNTRTFTMDDVYNLGYQDAIDQKPFGASLPSDRKDILFSNEPSPTTGVYDSFDYIPTPPPKKNNIGFGTLMAAMAILRTVKELGFVNGKFEPSVFIANARSLPQWKMAFSLYLLYRVVSAFI